MAAIVTDNDFVDAFEVWKRTHSLVYSGIDSSARVVYRLDPNPMPPPVNFTVDVTPPLNELEAAFDVVLAERAAAEGLAEALAALETGRLFLQDQLDRQTPLTLTQLVNAIKPVVDGNTFLTQWMTRYLNVYTTATTLATSMNPNTDPLRARYILALTDIISLRKPVG